MVKMWSIDCIRIFGQLVHSKKHVYMFDVYLVWCRKSWVFLGIPRHQCGSATLSWLLQSTNLEEDHLLVLDLYSCWLLNVRLASGNWLGMIEFYGMNLKTVILRTCTWPLTCLWIFYIFALNISKLPMKMKSRCSFLMLDNRLTVDY